MEDKQKNLDIFGDTIRLTVGKKKQVNVIKKTKYLLKCQNEVTGTVFQCRMDIPEGKVFEVEFLKHYKNTIILKKVKDE
jgi:hypothetical protein